MYYYRMDTGCRVRVALLLSVLQLVYFGRADIVSGGADAWSMVTTLNEADGESFKTFVQPLVEMSANAYRYPYVHAIPGWTQLDAVAPVHGGMHAILYKEDFDSNRMVISFRGTDTSGDESSLADQCADSLLWRMKSGASPNAPDCSSFSNETLDYYKQALEFSEKVIKTYPDASLLLTGHSLGAGLALLVTASVDVSPSLPVVAFSSPGIKQTLQLKHLKLSAEQERSLYLISDEWDEVMQTTWEDQVGTTCLYSTPKNSNCEVCFDSVNDSTSWQRLPPHLQKATPNEDSDPEVERIPGFTNACWTCFLETHILKHVIALVNLGVKPICEFHTSEALVSSI
ncbi:hypothetical protein Mapa_011489 [Marchantia paleacea]|nr:hypothetical protein Mapa_011489 [Marchantia paleacea]